MSKERYALLLIPFNTMFKIQPESPSLDTAMNTCPCCSEVLLRHARQSSIYWFCPHCRQEMPNFSSVASVSRARHQALDDWMVGAFDLVHKI